MYRVYRQDLLYHAFRHLLLTAQPSSASAPSADLLEAARSAVSDAPPQAGLGAVAALAAGPSTSYAAQAPDSTRLQELMQLQARDLPPPRPPLCFPIQWRMSGQVANWRIGLTFSCYVAPNRSFNGRVNG